MSIIEKEAAEQALLGLKRGDVPDNVIERLRTLRDELITGLGPALASLVVFGGVARGRWRTGRSDVNVAVVLENDDAQLLAKAAPAFRKAWRASRIEPLLLRRSDLADIARAFPSKLRDIRQCHVVLQGEDLFGAVSAPRERVLWRIEQALENAVLRFRRTCAFRADTPPEIVEAVADQARPTAMELAALLDVAGAPALPDDRSTTIFAAAARAFDLDGDVLAAAAEARLGHAVAMDPLTLADRWLKMLRRAAAVARSLSGPTR